MSKKNNYNIFRVRKSKKNFVLSYFENKRK